MLARRIERDTPTLHRRRGAHPLHRPAQWGGTGARAEMDWAESLTEANQGLTLFVAFNYGGRAEILDAADLHGTTEGSSGNCLYAPDMHDPDMIIRTGGEQRLSNYLLWQSAYAELVFRDEMWPDFNRQALEESLAEFSVRRRRFGGR